MAEERNTRNTAPIERVKEATYRQLQHREKAHYDPTQPYKLQRALIKAERRRQAEKIAKALLES